MNLENKIVNVVSLSVVTYPPEARVTINVSEEIMEGVFKTIGTYDMKFDILFHSASDPALLNLIYEKLAQLP